MPRLGFGAGNIHRYLGLKGNLGGTSGGGGNTGGGTGGTGYVAGGVTFANGVNLATPSLAVADSTYVALSYWVRYPTTVDRKLMIYASDAQNNEMNWAAVYNGGADDGMMGATFGEDTNFNFERGVGHPVTINQWHHFLIVFKGEAANGQSDQLVIYQNRQLVTQVGTHTHHATTPFVPDFANRSFNVASDSYGTIATADVADFWFAVGHNFLEADGTISAATLDKFVTSSLQPVNLGANGENPLGVAPAIFLHRDGSLSNNAADFATNHGTGGTFTLDGPLTVSASNP